MKNSIYPIATFCLLFPAVAFAQGSTTEQRNISKKIEVTIENGVKTVTVETTENGNTTAEIHTGEAADQYLEEQHQNDWDSRPPKTFFFDDHIQLDSLNHPFELKIDPDDAYHYNFFHMFPMDSMMKNLHFEWKGEFGEEMKRLMEDMEKLHQEMGNWNRDSMMQLPYGNGDVKIMILDDEEMDDATKEELKKMGIDITIDSKNNVEGKKITRKVIVARIVMIEDMEQDKKLKELEDVNLGFYPNPGNGDFTLEFTIEEDKDEAVITIHDLTGKIIYTETVKGKGNYKKQISLHEPSGVYIIKIQQGKRAITKKLIIQ